MHRRQGRAWIAATIIATLLLPIAGSTAGPKATLRRTDRRLQTVRGQLRRDQFRARSTKRRISALNRAITRVQIAVNDLDADIDVIRSAVRSSLARVGRMQRAIDKLKRVATEQAVLLYKSGGADTLNALLDAGSISEFNDRIELLGVAAQNNTGALVQYGRLRVAIEAENRALFAKQDELAQSRAAHARILRQRSALKAQLAQELTSLNRRIGRDKTREGHLEDAADKIKKQIVALQAKRTSVALGTSSEGFIWPLNGPITSPFGPRWGSVHTGIDIDGYTGQPIVAAKAGSVIYLGAGMTGYGNTIVLDHGGGISTLYAHMSDYAASLGTGVDQGQVIGYVGCTGNCYGDHLHFEVRINGNPVDPMGYLP